VDDFAVWEWSPILHDQYDGLLGHNNSEMDRYSGAAASVLERSPGSSTYGSMVDREYVPITWDLAAGETWTFEFPTGNVVYYDPNLTPIGADPEDEYVAIVAPLAMHETKPATYGTFNPVTKVWTVTGPSVTGGPNGSPGNYPLEGWGAISLAAVSGGPAPTADLSASVTSGPAPLSVSFTDLSLDSPVSWLWDFGDSGATSTDQNPIFEYTADGTYTVSLTATNANGIDTVVETDLIFVPEPGATLQLVAGTIGLLGLQRHRRRCRR
jgi:PKD repeat protein